MAETAWNDARALKNGAATLFEAALLNDPEAEQNIKNGAGAAWDYVANRDNWPYLLGDMTPENREQFAQAYERGDGNAVGRIMGEQAINLLSTYGPPVAGGIKKVSKLVKIGEKAEDAVKVEKTASKAATKSPFASKSLATGADEAVFWSGIRNGDASAAEWVARHGGSTLETTLADHEN